MFLVVYTSFAFLLFFINTTSCDVSELRGYNYHTGGYSYPVPVSPFPPVQFDEPSTPAPVYLPPPIFQDEVFPPIPPQIPVQPVPTYLPPNLYPPIGQPPNTINDEDTVAISPPSGYLPPSNAYLPPPPINNFPQMKILNMSCVLDSSFKCIFRVEGKSGNSFLPPVIEDGQENCVSSSVAGNNIFQIDLEDSRRMLKCGVKRCAVGNKVNNMCLVARMPTVRGIKLPEDCLVTFQCTPQDRVVSHTRHVKIGANTVNTGFKGRSFNGITATGGGPKDLKTRLQLLRKSPGSSNFDQFVQPDSAVHLGEELVLRAVIDEGDGWKYSLLGPVVIRSSSFKKSAVLVQENGCRNPEMRSVCPFEPRHVTPLDTLLHFRAFLFQEAPKGDEMILSVRMQGCIHSQDCFQNGLCNDSGNWTPPLRHKRDANQAVNFTKEYKLEENLITNLESQFAFKVQTNIDDEVRSAGEKVNNSSSRNEFYFIYVALGFCMLCLLITLVIYRIYGVCSF